MKLEVVEVFGDVRAVPISEGLRRFGVSPGGPYDAESHAHAVLTAHGPEDVLELSNGRARLRATVECTLGIAGECESPGCLSLSVGEETTVVVSTHGMRVYIAVGGNRDLPDLKVAITPASLEERTIGFLPGPQADMFDLNEFAEREWRVANDSDRMGLRLQGEPIPGGRELPSQPSAPGVVQIAGGRPIVLGPDGPTIGGYPKIGWLPQASLDRCAQLRPGAPVRFELISEREIGMQEHERKERLRRLARALDLRDG